MVDGMTTGVIDLFQGVLPVTRKITISIPNELFDILDALSIKWNTTRSGVFTRLLKEVEAKCPEQEMTEGYMMMAERNIGDMEMYLPVQAEALTLNDKAR